MSTLESIRDALGDIGRQDFPTLNLHPGPWSYRVGAVRADGRCDLVAVKKGPPPELPNVDHWSASGAASKPTVGSIVVVSFLDGDPGSPMIGAYEPLRFAGGAPTEATLDADLLRLGPSATLVQLAPGPMAILSGVARIGDTVALSGITITAPAGGGPCTFSPGATVLTGTITTGSAKVKSA